MIENEKKQFVIETAYNMVKIHGWNNISMRKLSSKVNISLPILYRMFVNKDGLMVDVVKQSLEKLNLKLEFIANNSDSPVIDAVDTLYDFFATNDFVFDYLFRKEVNFQSAIVRKKVVDGLTNLFEIIGYSDATRQALIALTQITGQLIMANEFGTLDKDIITIVKNDKQPKAVA
ncbi:MAG: TetR/AcrR family transcriptional regulator [Patescibacteria group bacterium]